MPTLNAVLDDWVAGDDEEVGVSVDTLPTGTTVTKAWLTVKADKDDPDVNARFQKVITTANVAGEGQITDNGAGDANAALRFDVTDTNTLTLTPGTTYFFDVQIQLNDGRLKTVWGGTIVTIQQVTIAIS